MKKNKIEYALKMIEFHSKLLIKWSKYVQSVNEPKKQKEYVPKGQINIFEVEDE